MELILILKKSDTKIDHGNISAGNNPKVIDGKNNKGNNKY